jgi:hypothetical protein
MKLLSVDGFCFLDVIKAMCIVSQAALLGEGYRETHASQKCAVFLRISALFKRAHGIT